MITKLNAAKIVLSAGKSMVLANGSNINNLFNILNGEIRRLYFQRVW